MCELFADDVFFKNLRKIDYDLLLLTKALPCPHCGGKLDTSNIPRKPRGAGELETLRFSLCCRNDGCRRRLTPPSLRFLGQKVYSAWVVILYEFVEKLGLKKAVARKTIARWRNFWNERLARNLPFMRRARSFLPPDISDSSLPSSLPSSFFNAFEFPDKKSWIPILSFFTQPF